jgi:hypothetical protein
VDHPSEDTLKRFAACTASRQEARAVVAHLLQGCAVCSGRLKSLMEPANVPGPAYENALNRFDRNLIEALEASIRPVEMLREAPHSPDSLPRRERGN